MERLITEQKDREIGFQLRMNPVGRLFSDTNYFIKLNVCSNPTCNCGAVNMVIIKEENLGTSDIEYCLPIDVHEEEVRSKYNKDLYAKEGDGGYIQGLFKNGLAAEDWISLRKEYFISKFELLADVNLDEVDFEFEEEHYRNPTLMFFYTDAFPCSEFYAELKGKNYVIFDTYCKNPTCPCTDVFLSFYEIEQGEEQNKTTHIAEYFYNYKTKKGKIKEGNQALMSSILQGIYHNYRDLDSLFRQRSQVVKELYIKSKRIYDKARQAQTTVKISRNQPCPCGSGKKYKRCCLKKDEARG